VQAVAAAAAAAAAVDCVDDARSGRHMVMGLWREDDYDGGAMETREIVAHEA